MQIRPIRTNADHAAALERIAELMGAKKDSADGAELDALVTLVDAFEGEQIPMDAPDAVAIIEFYLDQNHMTRKALEPLIGSRARVSEVLSRKRPLTLAMIRRLHASFGISADLLIGTIETGRRNASLSRRKARKMSARGVVRSAGTHSGPERRSPLPKKARA